MVKGKLVLAGIGLALALGSQAVPAHAGAQGPARGTVETMHMDGTARSLDQSSIGSIPPPQWNTPRFDDSSWVPVRPVASGIGSCVRKAIYAVYRPSYSGAIYWGDNLTDHYLFRQTFSLPKAHDYYGSEIGVVGQFVASAFSIYINGTQVNTGYGGSSSYYQGYATTSRRTYERAGTSSPSTPTRGQRPTAPDCNSGPSFTRRGSSSKKERTTMPITACSVALATALAVSTIHPATVAVPHALQAQRMMREVEHDLATDDYNDAYTISFSRLHMSRATFLAHTPPCAVPPGLRRQGHRDRALASDGDREARHHRGRPADPGLRPCPRQESIDLGVRDHVDRHQGPLVLGGLMGLDAATLGPWQRSIAITVW